MKRNDNTNKYEFEDEADLLLYMKHHVTGLVIGSDKFARWDCETTRSIIELKVRGWHYNTQLIERHKYNALIDEASRSGRMPIYLVADSKGIYYYNLLNVKEPEWEVKALPTTTEFSDTSIRNKEIGYLDTRDAVHREIEPIVNTTNTNTTTNTDKI